MKKINLPFIFLMFLFKLALSQPDQKYCQHFNGSQILILPDNSLLNLQSSFTLESWIYLESASPYGIILGKTNNPRANDPFQNYVLTLDPSGLKPEFIQTTGISGSYTAATSPNNISLNTWTHISATLNGGQMKLYINGILVSTNTSPGNTSSSTGVPFSVGSGATPSLQNTCCGITGNVFQARVWNKANSQSEIQSNMNIHLTGNEIGLAACWPMNDNNGQNIQDISPNAFHLTRGTSINIDNEDPTVFLTSKLGPFFSIKTIVLPNSSTISEELFVMDYNSDNLKDIIVSRLVWPPTYPASLAPIQCLKNNGGLTFLNDSPIVGVDNLVHARDFSVEDFNGDGKEDIFIADHGTDVMPFPGGQNRIYFQNSNSQLIESSNGNIPLISDFSHNTASSDIDNDGDIDIYVCNIYGQQLIGPRLLINNGTGQFTVNTLNLPSSIINLDNVYMSSKFADIDNDSDMDLILGAIDKSGTNQDLLLLNNGSGNFTISPNALPNRYGNSSWGTVEIEVADVNNDGFKDLIMSTLYQYQTCQLQLLINNKNGTFSDSTQNIPQSWPLTNSWMKWIESSDFNNDGWVDFVVCLHGGQPRLYLNTGNTKFVDATAILPISSSIASYRARDFDNDGKYDIAFLDFSGNIIIAKNLKPYTVEIDSSGISNSTNNIKEKYFENLVIFPNPIISDAILHSSQYIDNASIEIINTLGQIVKKITNISGYSINLNCDNLINGVYIIKIKKDTNLISSSRIIINK